MGPPTFYPYELSWGDRLPTCELKANSLSSSFVEYVHDTARRERLVLRAKLLSELLEAIICPEFERSYLGPGQGKGHWAISRFTVRGDDDHVELWMFGSLRLEVRVDTSQGLLVL